MLTVFPFVLVKPLVILIVVAVVIITVLVIFVIIRKVSIPFVPAAK